MPKLATLATAKPRLTGPPEGYSKKKELQVKHWIAAAVQQAANDAPGGAPEIAAEVQASCMVSPCLTS